MRPRRWKSLKGRSSPSSPSSSLSPTPTSSSSFQSIKTCFLVAFSLLDSLVKWFFFKLHISNSFLNHFNRFTTWTGYNSVANSMDLTSFLSICWFLIEFQMNWSTIIHHHLPTLFLIRQWYAFRLNEWMLADGRWRTFTLEANSLQGKHNSPGLSLSLFLSKARAKIKQKHSTH